MRSSAAALAAAQRVMSSTGSMSPPPAPRAPRQKHPLRGASASAGAGAGGAGVLLASPRPRTAEALRGMHFSWRDHGLYNLDGWMYGI